MKNQIVIFGGYHAASHNMFILTEEGELKEDISDGSIIPGTMCSASFTVEKEKIYAAGRHLLNGKHLSSVGTFDGGEWVYHDDSH